MQEQGTFKATVPVRPGVFAQLLAHLLDGSEAFLGTLTWRRFIKRRESVALVDKTYTLFRATGHGYDLCIPQWQSLRVLELLVFYHDGSVLEVKLGSKSPYSYRILARGDEEARRRVNLGQVCLKRKPLPRVIVFAKWLLLAIGVLLVAAIRLLHLYTTTVNRYGRDQTESTTAGSWAGLGVVLCLVAFIGIHRVLNVTHEVLPPRSDLIVEGRTRLATLWDRLQFDLEDLRRFIIAFVAGVAIFLLGRIVR